MIKESSPPEVETVGAATNGEFKYDGKLKLRDPETDAIHEIDCYFAKNDNDKSATVELTSKSIEVKTNAYTMKAGNGGGGAVVISWQSGSD